MLSEVFKKQLKIMFFIFISIGVFSAFFESKNNESILIGVLISLITLTLFILISKLLFKCFFYLYPILYYKSKSFLNLKSDVEEYVKNCNELNCHIEELKDSYVDIKQTNYGTSTFIDSSSFNYKRPYISQNKSNYIYDCSLTICRNANNQPFKYLCKYFNIDTTEESLEKFEKVLNDFLAAEEGKILLDNEVERIKLSIEDQIPWIIRRFNMNTFMVKLGFGKINLNSLYFPIYSFRYISPGGNKLERYDIDTLSDFIKYLSNLVNFKKSVAGQRALMTPSLRKKIKQRDNYTCQKCGISIKDEQHLLLEIDHIIPLSKGGMTTEDNLQTLCWKCNRLKSSKLI